jgi:glycosyltransferase involved in cell wall biosynthesis
VKKLKIGILGSRGVPNNYGGFEQFAQYLSEGLYKRGHDVWVYNSHRHPYQEKEWNGVQIIHCKDWEYKFGTAGQFFYDRNCINDARKRNFDVLLHLGYTSDSVWHRRWPKDAVNMINMDGLEWQRKKYNQLTRRFLKRTERLAAIHGDVLVADSIAIQEYIKNTYGKTAHYTPYAAEVFEHPDAGQLKNFQLQPNKYYMLMARMVPENNIETIIKGYLLSSQTNPLLIIGDTSNRFGKYLVSKYNHPAIIYSGPLFDIERLNNLRYYSLYYFHGHSVGGTNPSLLEAMACGCSIIAHDNIFNKSILGADADYFTDEKQIAGLLNTAKNGSLLLAQKNANLEKVRTLFHPDKIIDAYEKLMLNSRNK